MSKARPKQASNQAIGNVVFMADWLAAKHPQPTARMYDIRPNLPVQRAGLAQPRMASGATKAGTSSETEQPFSLTDEEIAELAAILDARLRARRMATS